MDGGHCGHYTERDSKIGFGAARKFPRINDRKWSSIKSIQAHLRSLIPGILARSKTNF